MVDGNLLVLQAWQQLPSFQRSSEAFQSRNELNSLRSGIGDGANHLNSFVFAQKKQASAIYRSLRALRARNRKKSLKKGLLGGGLEKSLKKYPKKSRNTDFRTFLGIFSVFLDFFGYFSRLFSRPPKRPFLRPFCDFGPGGPGDSCKWRLGSQLLRLAQRVFLLGRLWQLLLRGWWGSRKRRGFCWLMCVLLSLSREWKRIGHATFWHLLSSTRRIKLV